MMLACNCYLYSHCERLEVGGVSITSVRHGIRGQVNRLYILDTTQRLYIGIVLTLAANVCQHQSQTQHDE